VLIPDENVKDLAEIPDNIKGNLNIRPVKWIDEVLQIALVSQPVPLVAPTPSVEAKPRRAARRGLKPSSAH
jgi:ATP-dependent Lon protease